MADRKFSQDMAGAWGLAIRDYKNDTRKDMATGKVEPTCASLSEKQRQAIMKVNKNSIAFRNIEPGTDISIYDTTGKCIKTFAMDGDSEIPLPSGIYLIKYAGRTVKIIL